MARQDINQALLQSSFLDGANGAYVEALQARYERDPNSVEPGWRDFFDALGDDPQSVEKTAEGMQAIQWYREGKLLEIAEYWCYDVKLTRLVHEYAVQHGELHYHNRFGKKMTVPVKW